MRKATYFYIIAVMFGELLVITFVMQPSNFYDGHPDTTYLVEGVLILPYCLALYYFVYVLSHTAPA